jgi:hypothetical protein
VPADWRHRTDISRGANDPKHAYGAGSVVKQRCHRRWVTAFIIACGAGMPGPDTGYKRCFSPLGSAARFASPLIAAGDGSISFIQRPPYRLRFEGKAMTNTRYLHLFMMVPIQSSRAGAGTAPSSLFMVSCRIVEDGDAPLQASRSGTNVGVPLFSFVVFKWPGRMPGLWLELLEAPRPGRACASGRITH